MRALDQAPSIKDLDREKRFCNLKNVNEGRNNNDDDDDDDDDNNIDSCQEVIYHCRNLCHHRLGETNHHFHLHRQFRQ